MIFEKYKNKKGMEDVTFAILAVAGLLIITMFAYKTYVNVKESMAVQGCKNSIDAHSFIIIQTARDIFTDIKCPTNEITIKDLKKTNEIIAEDMHRCWYMWGQGKKEYFKGEGNFCYICSVYKFGDKGQQVQGLTQYIGTQPIRVRYPGDVKGLSYQDYLQGYETPNSANIIKNREIESINKVDALNTSQKYATIFVYASGKTAIEKALEGNRPLVVGATVIGFGVAGKSAVVLGKLGMAAINAAATTGGGAGAGGIAASSLVASEVTIFSATGGIISTTPVIAVSGGYATMAGSGILVPLSSVAPVVAAPVVAGGAAGAATTTAAATVLGITPIGWVAIGVGALIVTGVGIYMLLDTPDPQWISFMAFRPYNTTELDALSCEQLVINQQSNAGK